MLYYSTNLQSPAVSLREAVMRGLADDGGLYLPESVPVMTPSFFKSIGKLTHNEVALEVARAFLEDDVPEDVLEGIINESLDFMIPLKHFGANVYCLELFHGPTMAFKDVGARFMSRLMSYLYRNEDRALNVLVATSGDTGSAVAAGFHGVEGINVFVLFPGGKISPLQQKQITTWGGNIYALEVDGSFDDCQKLTKQMLGDRQLNDSFPLTSANSINIARLIPQSFYYFFAFARLDAGRIDEARLPLVFSVPCGNFGNLTGGLLAQAAGLPVLRFVASTNINDVFPRFMETGEYKPAASIPTISNAMDVGDPSNFARINELMGKKIENFRESITAYSYSDDDTSMAIGKLHAANGYIMDPHGAVAYLGLRQFMSEYHEAVNGIFLETAHPAKFSETMKHIIDDFDDLPPQLQEVLNREEKFHSIGNDPEELKALIEEVNL
jgi:threonine synthase